jgi:hypothetical protein
MPENTNPSNGFNTFLADVRHGQVLDELKTALNNVVSGVKATGKKGRMTLEIEIAPASKGEKGDNIPTYITARVSEKVPKPDVRPAIYFTTADNRLQRNNPAQKELELRTVEAPVVPVREVVPQAPVKVAAG